MSVAQAEFTRAIFDATRPVPDGLVGPDGGPAGKRFDVYRNNVVVSLTEALEIAFPVVAKLIGSKNFRAVAGLYLRRHPPRSPVLMFYGDRMAAFLADFEPLRHVPYLADIARLEQALRRSYHAADATPLDPAQIQRMPPERLMAARVILAPAVHLIRSRYPVHGIWRYNTEDSAPTPAPQGENVLITRPEYDPRLTTLAPGGGTFVDALIAGRTFGAAHDAALAQVPEFDLAATLGTLFSGAGIQRLEEDPVT